MGGMGWNYVNLIWFATHKDMGDKSFNIFRDTGRLVLLFNCLLTANTIKVNWREQIRKSAFSIHFGFIGRKKKLPDLVFTTYCPVYDLFFLNF